jgi:hypothetical protein
MGVGYIAHVCNGSYDIEEPRGLKQIDCYEHGKRKLIQRHCSRIS